MNELSIGSKIIFCSSQWKISDMWLVSQEKNDVSGEKTDKWLKLIVGVWQRLVVK